jgi:PTS system galactitol-specific IIA component
VIRKPEELPMEQVVESKLKIGVNLVHVFHERVTREHAIRMLATALYDGGYVKESYIAAVLEREKEYPTGLPTTPIGVAIPHTDSEHVYGSALAVGILSEAIAFQEMGSVDSEVSVHIISMMAIADPKSVMPVLRTLALAYQDPGFLTLLKRSGSEQAVLDLLSARIPDVIERI